MDRLPLGDYELFRWWSDHAKSWGPPDAGWRAWFGGRVIDGLCQVLDEHLAADRLGNPAAIGCVPRLDSEAVVDRLLQMTAVCVVLDKGAALLPARLVNSELGFPNAALPRLHDMTPAANGEALLVGPYTSSEATEHDIEPVRVVGWRGAGRKPLLHAKLLVLGEIDVVSYGPDDGPGLEGLRFLPQSVWWGSANWTERSRSHLEVGFMCNDPSLAGEATDFIADVIAFSEPVGTTCAGPEPNLLRVQYDDDAMAEADREHYFAHLEEEEQREQALQYFEWVAESEDASDDDR